MLAAAVVTAGAAADRAGLRLRGNAPANCRSRYERACLRIPNLQIRTDNFITRLNGDATVKGSLAWLQAQIDDATAKGRTQLATVLQNRLAVRTQTLEVLKVRQQRLAKLAEMCRAHGVEI